MVVCGMHTAVYRAVYRTCSFVRGDRRTVLPDEW